MRLRTIKPGFFKNEVLAGSPFECRLLFSGLWCLADREGRLENRPARIAAELFPYDKSITKVVLEHHLGFLERAGFIVCYEVDGNAYIQVVKWKEHQRPHIRESASLIPSPSNDLSKKHNLGSAKASPRRLGSCLLSSGSGVLDPEKDCADASSIKYPSDYETFYTAFPRHVGKGEGLKAYQKAKKLLGENAAQILLAGVERYKKTDQARGEERFIPHPARWLNARRWEDEPPAAFVDPVDVAGEKWARESMGEEAYAKAKAERNGK